MATDSKPFLPTPRRSNAFGLLVAGGILFVLGLGGSSILLGSPYRSHASQLGRA
jgi:hypothetical protein